MEICSTGFFFKCYFEAKQALWSALQGDMKSPLNPELMLYILKEEIWFDQKQNIQDIVDHGGASNYVYAPAFPATYAEMQLAMNGVYVNRNDLKAAEESASAAIMGLLVSDPSQSYRTCKILVGLLGALYSEQDIVGAFQLLAVIDPYINSHLSHESVPYAAYVDTVGQLLSFTNNYPIAVQTLRTASELYKKLDIAPEIRDYSLAINNSLTSAALAIQGNIKEAGEVHAQHPMRAHREEIIARGSFATYQEFYYAVSDVFLSTLSNSRPDSRWKPLFEKKPVWDVSDYQLSVVNSYRSFALACLELSAGNRSQATSLFMDAADQRLSIFEKFQRANFEGFQLPSLVDKIVIGLALKAAADAKSPKAADLMLRSGEVLLRNLRYSISDEAVLIASQPDQKSRENAHAYINLVQQKRAWELSNIEQWLKAPDPNKKGALLQEYTSVVTTLSKLKDQFISGSSFVQSNGLPSLRDVQSALSTEESFVTYFPMPTGFGRLCIAKDAAFYSFGTIDKTAINNARLVEFATTANYAPNAELDSQFPVEAAIYLNKLLFDGLDQCMKPGSHIIMALPQELAGVPVAVLLSEPPPRLGDGYDLKHAQWLIRKFSFSFVISARQFLAVTKQVAGTAAPMEYLGVGDPKLDDQNRNELSLALTIRDKANSKLKLTELPETADELNAVAKLFNPSKRDILIGANATEETFRSKPLSDYDVIHFATHGLFDQDVKSQSESSLIFTPVSSSDPFNDGILSASEISRLSLRARLVVLSACNSARYNQQQANLGVHDLQAAFTVAGTPTILAALWPVESATTAKLIESFFSSWQAGSYGGAAQSLAQTIRAFLDSSDGPHQHPRFWAPFEIFGNGAIRGLPSQGSAISLDTFKPLKGFSSGGEITSAAPLGSNVVLSLFGQWDGKRMARIISDRDMQGNEKWRYTSREIGASAITTSSGLIYALGLKGVDHFIPVVQALDQFGHLLWTREFPDLTDYTFASLVAFKSGVLIVAYPLFGQGASDKDAYLLNVDSNGINIAKVSFKVDSTRHSGSAQNAIVRTLNDHVVVAVNVGSSLRLNPKRKNILGWPSVCFEGASVSLFEFDGADLKLRSTRSLDLFQADAIVAWNNSLFIGGESLDGCDQKGTAAVLEIQPGELARTFWRGDNIFPSSVRGMVIENGLNIVVNYERAIGINIVKPVNLDQYVYNKRYGDDNMAIREGAIFRLSPNGDIRLRQDFSAGLSVYFVGVTAVDGALVGYGSLGGEPATTLH